MLLFCVMFFNIICNSVLFELVYLFYILLLVLFNWPIPGINLG